MAMILGRLLGRLLCFFGLHNYSIYFKAVPKLIRTHKNNKYYYSLRYDIYQIYKCDECNKMHSKIKIRSDLKELQAKMYLQRIK